MNNRNKVPSEEKRASFGLVRSSKAEAEENRGCGARPGHRGLYRHPKGLWP